MGRRVLRRHIWGYTVCLCPTKGTRGLYELTFQLSSISLEFILYTTILYSNPVHITVCVEDEYLFIAFYFWFGYALSNSFWSLLRDKHIIFYLFITTYVFCLNEFRTFFCYQINQRILMYVFIFLIKLR